MLRYCTLIIYKVHVPVIAAQPHKERIEPFAPSRIDACHQPSVTHRTTKDMTATPARQPQTPAENGFTSTGSPLDTVRGFLINIWIPSLTNGLEKVKTFDVPSLIARSTMLRSATWYIILCMNTMSQPTHILQSYDVARQRSVQCEIMFVNSISGGLQILTLTLRSYRNNVRKQRIMVPD